MSDNQSVASVWSLWKHKQLTHLISDASEINTFICFLDSSATFFKSTAHFLGAPSRDRTWLSVFRPFYCVLEAFLKKRMALPIWKSYMRCWRKNRNFNIKFNVIELYVIKSWWKIKFNKRKVYHQLFFSFFLSVKLALKNLDKLDYVVTELILRKK